MSLFEDKFRREISLVKGRLFLLHDGEVIMSPEFESGEDFYIDEYEFSDEFMDIIDDFIEKFGYDNVDKDTCEIFSRIASETPARIFQFMCAINNLDDYELVVTVGETKDANDTVCYSEKSDTFYILENDGIFGEEATLTPISDTADIEFYDE